MNHGFYIKISSAILLIFLSTVAGWFVSRNQYSALESEMLNSGNMIAKSRVEDLTNSVNRNLNFLSGIPGFFIHAVRVNRSLALFGANVTKSKLPYQTRKARWLKDPVLNDLDRTMAIARSNFKADIIFIANAAGDIIAASNWNKPTSSVGINIADREYFIQNRAGQNAEEYAVGKTTHVSGLFFSRPVFANGKFMGAVVAKVNVSDLSFLVRHTDAFISDTNGVIILSHDKSKEMYSLAGSPITRMPAAQRQSIYRKTDFPEYKIQPWGDENYSSILRIQDMDMPQVMESRSIPEYGLTVHATANLPHYFHYKNEKNVLFFLLSALGSLISLSAFGGFLYVRAINQSSEKLLKSEFRFKTLAEGTFEGIAITSFGKFVDVNNQLLKILGYERNEMIGKSIMDFMAPRIHDRAAPETLEEVADSAEHAMIHKNGSQVIVEIHEQVIEQDGQSLRLLAIHEITERKRMERLFQEKMLELQTILDNTTVGVALIRDRKLIWGNRHMCEMFGYSPEELAGTSTSIIYKSREDFDAVGNTAYPSLLLGNQYNCDVEMKRRDGSLFWTSISGHMIDVDNPALGSIWVLEDITYRKQSEEDLRIAAATFETQEAILITDPDSRILRVNEAFQEVTGYSAEEVVGKNPSILKSGRHDAAFYQDMWAALLTTGKWSGEIWDKRKNGEIYPKAITITAVRDNQHRVTHYVAVFRDITRRKKAAQEIHQLAFYDPLTQLPNRRMLLDRLNQALATSARNDRYGAILFLDLDHFKTINDTKGHAVGDKLLIEVARRLPACVREGDSVARLGGDEFVVVLEGLNEMVDEAATQAERIAEKIQKELSQSYLLDSDTYQSTVSIGISLFQGHQDCIEDLLKHADAAMYQAKAAGRNTIRFFDPEVQTVLEARAELEADLHQALEKWEFQLYYQIQVNGRGQPIGAEVLLRWQHNVRGMVSPKTFISLAEETGLIIPIGAWVLQTACAQLKAWQDNAITRDLTLSVNVSARQFRQSDFVSRVQRVVLAHGVKPFQIKLELTESTVLEDVEDTISKMRELREWGVRFSMDDFGTGYSSLQYLKRLPLDQIKIDQSFVRDITTDPNDAAIVQTIIAMTETLGLDVIAEGVETEEQREFLDLRGCHAFQGYLFGRPLPLEQFEEQIRQANRKK